MTLLALACLAATRPARDPVASPELRQKFIPSFALKYGGTGGWPSLEEAARYDVLLLGAGSLQSQPDRSIPENTCQVLKKLNPRQVLFLYEMGAGEYNAADWGRLGKGWDWMKQQHGPDSADRWTAVGAKSGGCLQGQGYGNEHLMLPGNPAWQQFWLEKIYEKYWGDPTKPTAVADGIFSDNTQYAMPYIGGWHAEGHADMPDVPADFFPGGVYDTALFHQQMKSFFGRAFPWLAARKVKIALNFGDMDRRPADWTELDNENDAPFAAMEEGAFVHPWGGKGSFVFRSEEECLKQIRVMRSLRHVRALMNVHGPVAGESKGLERMDARDASGNRAWDILWYAMMSFVQGLNENSSNAYMNFTVWGYTEFYWLKEFDVRYLDLGCARSESRRLPGRQGHVYAREFEKGWAVVNPTTRSSVGIVVPEGEARIIDHDSLEAAGDRPLVREFDLASHRGVVLLKPDRDIGRAERR